MRAAQEEVGRLRSRPRSIDTRHKAPRLGRVFAIRLAKYFCEKSLFGACPQVTSDCHHHERRPHDRSRYPDGAAECQQVQSHIDRMPQEPEWPSGRELMTGIDGSPETP